MPLTLQLDSSAPPDAVLAAIRDDMREWRESVIPAALRDDGVLQVEGRFSTSAFRLSYAIGNREHAGPMPSLRGTVTPRDGGGSRVKVVIGVGWGHLVALVPFALIGLAFSRVIPLLFIALGVYWYRSRSDRNAPTVAYLLDRVSTAVKRASAAPAGSPAPRA